MKIPAMSLKNLGAYARLLQTNNLPAEAVITTIGFDPAFSFPVLTFTFGGVLDGAQYAKLQSRMGEAEEVLGVKRNFWLFPIPQTDILSDPDLNGVNNPGY